jgi:hypothetical protein
MFDNDSEDSECTKLDIEDEIIDNFEKLLNIF